jgi:hypothetical protein
MVLVAKWSCSSKQLTLHLDLHWKQLLGNSSQINMLQEFVNISMVRAL